MGIFMINRLAFFIICIFILIIQSACSLPVYKPITDFRFVVMSDSQGLDNGVNSEVVNKIMKNVKTLNPQPEFAVLIGDLCMGGSNYSEVKGQLTYLKKILTDYYPASFYFPGVGNHETCLASGGEHAFRQVFSEFNANFLLGYENTVYYFDYGNSRFYMLNSDYPGETHKVSFNQLEWLKSHIDSSKKHNFFFAHEPLFPTGPAIGFSLDMHRSERNFFWSIIDNSPSPMFFSGHEHFYSRRHLNSSIDQNEDIASKLKNKEFLNSSISFPYYVTNYEFSKDVCQLTLGGFGGPLSRLFIDKRNVDVPPIPEHCYVVVDIKDNIVEVNVYNPDGKVLDFFKQNY